MCKNSCTSLDCKSPYVSSVSMRRTSNIWLRRSVRARKACITTFHTTPSQVQHKAYSACFSSIIQLDFSESKMGNLTISNRPWTRATSLPLFMPIACFTPTAVGFKSLIQKQGKEGNTRASHMSLGKHVWWKIWVFQFLHKENLFLWGECIHLSTSRTSKQCVHLGHNTGRPCI